MTSLRLDPEKTWLKSTTLWGALIITVTGTMLYARMDSAIRTIQTTIERDAAMHEKDRDAIVGSIREVRDELRKLVGESVSLRQGNTWVDVFQLTMDAWLERVRSDNPSLKVPEFKVPPVPR